MNSNDPNSNGSFYGSGFGGSVDPPPENQGLPGNGNPSPPPPAPFPRSALGSPLAAPPLASPPPVANPRRSGHGRPLDPNLLGFNFSPYSFEPTQMQQNPRQHVNSNFNATSSNVNYANVFPNLPVGQSQFQFPQSKTNTVTHSQQSVNSRNPQVNASNNYSGTMPTPAQNFNLRDVMTGDQNFTDQNGNQNQSQDNHQSLGQQQNFRNPNVADPVNNDYRNSHSSTFSVPNQNTAQNQGFTNELPNNNNTSSNSQTRTSNSGLFRGMGRGGVFDNILPNYYGYNNQSQQTPLNNNINNQTFSNTPMSHISSRSVEQITLSQVFLRLLSEFDQRSNAVDKIRVQDFDQLNNSNVNEFPKWKGVFQLQLQVNGLLHVISETYVKFSDIDSPDPTSEVYRNDPGLLQTKLALCRAQERVELKEIAKVMSIFIHVLKDSKSSQLIHNITMDTLPNVVWSELNKLHLNITLNKKMYAIRKFHEIRRGENEHLIEYILRMERYRDDLRTIYDHQIPDVEMIPFLEKALSGELRVAFLTWCGLEGACYAVLRQQLVDREHDDRVHKKTERAMVSFGSSFRSSRDRSRSFSRSRSRESRRSPSRSPYRGEVAYRSFDRSRRREHFSSQPHQSSSDTQHSEKSRDNRQGASTRGLQQHRHNNTSSHRLPARVGFGSAQGRGSWGRQSTSNTRSHSRPHGSGNASRDSRHRSPFRSQSRSPSRGSSFNPRTRSPRPAVRGSAHNTLHEYMGPVFPSDPEEHQEENTYETSSLRTDERSMDSREPDNTGTSADDREVHFDNGDNATLAGYVSNVFTNSSNTSPSSAPNCLTLDNTLRLGDTYDTNDLPHTIANVHHVTHTSINNMSDVTNGNIHDEPIVIAHCNMITHSVVPSDVPGVHTVLNNHVDMSLRPLPVSGLPIQVWTVYGKFEQFTVHAGRYLDEEISSKCQIQYPMHGNNRVMYVEAFYCRASGDVVESCTCDDCVKLTQRVLDPTVVRVQRLPRVNMCRLPFYDNVSMHSFYETQIDRISPTQAELDAAFRNTYYTSSDALRDFSVIQRIARVNIRPDRWSQSHTSYLPHGFIVDRRCNRDTDYVYCKNYYTDSLFRMQVDTVYPGLIPSHDTIIFTDFDGAFKQNCEWMLRRDEPEDECVYVETTYCPKSHIQVELCAQHGCTFCQELTRVVQVGTFQANVCLVRVTRYCYPSHWIDPQPPRVVIDLTSEEHSSSSSNASDDSGRSGNSGTDNTNTHTSSSTTSNSTQYMSSLNDRIASVPPPVTTFYSTTPQSCPVTKCLESSNECDENSEINTLSDQSCVSHKRCMLVCDCDDVLCTGDCVIQVKNNLAPDRSAVIHHANMITQSLDHSKYPSNVVLRDIPLTPTGGRRIHSIRSFLDDSMYQGVPLSYHNNVCPQMVWFADVHKHNIVYVTGSPQFCLKRGIPMDQCGCVVCRGLKNYTNTYVVHKGIVWVNAYDTLGDPFIFYNECDVLDKLNLLIDTTVRTPDSIICSMTLEPLVDELYEGPVVGHSEPPCALFRSHDKEQVFWG